jgi:hypothetical protein
MMNRMRRGVLGGLVVGLAIACGDGGYFVCSDDSDCVGRADGVCEAVGACSFPDEACPSGQRFGEASTPSVAGECVVDEGTTGGDPPDPTTDVTLDGGSQGPMSTTSGGDDTTDSGASSCPADWWDCAWLHRQRLTLSMSIPTPLDDVPVLVLLGPQRLDYALMQADGEDVRFVSESGAALPFEVERWDPESTSILWTNVDALGGDVDHLWLYYGNPVAQDAQDAAAVWPAPHVGVWHLEGEPLDSTLEGNDAEVFGGVEAAGGQVGEGKDFTDGSSRLQVAAADSLTNVFAAGGTVSAWIRPRGSGGSGFGRIFNKSTDAGGWLWFLEDDGAQRFLIELGASSIGWGTTAAVVPFHAWSHVAVTYDPAAGQAPRFFINGVEDVPKSEPMAPPVDAPSDEASVLTLGNRPDNQRRFDGLLDEMRIETTVRSPAWIAAQYHAMRDTLLIFGEVESISPAP